MKFSLLHKSQHKGLKFILVFYQLKNAEMFYLKISISTVNKITGIFVKFFYDEIYLFS